MTGIANSLQHLTDSDLRYNLYYRAEQARAQRVILEVLGIDVFDADLIETLTAKDHYHTIERLGPGWFQIDDAWFGADDLGNLIVQSHCRCGNAEPREITVKTKAPRSAWSEVSDFLKRYPPFNFACDDYRWHPDENECRADLEREAREQEFCRLIGGMA